MFLILKENLMCSLIQRHLNTSSFEKSDNTKNCIKIDIHSFFCSTNQIVQHLVYIMMRV